MAVKILRWAPGAGGDTLLKFAVKSNSNLHTNLVFTNSPDVSRTSVNYYATKQFKYKQITKMGMFSHDIDTQLLKQELGQFDAEHSGNWILKSHFYNITFDQDVIDIVIPNNLLPFVVLASVVKDPRADGLIQYQHPLIPKIKDKEILDKFDMYNIAKKEIMPKIYSDNQISLGDILGGWESFCNATKQVGIHIDTKFKTDYNNWTEANKKFMPSEKYKSLLSSNNLDHTYKELSLVEKYCLLALSGKKFKILT